MILRTLLPVSVVCASSRLRDSSACCCVSICIWASSSSNVRRRASSSAPSTALLSCGGGMVNDEVGMSHWWEPVSSRTVESSGHVTDPAELMAGTAAAPHCLFDRKGRRPANIAVAYSATVWRLAIELALEPRPPRSPQYCKTQRAAASGGGILGAGWRRSPRACAVTRRDGRRPHPQRRGTR